MKISIYVYEVEPGDVWNGRTVIAVEPPAKNYQTWQITFDKGKIECPSGDTKWLVERKVERIENGRI